MTGLLNSGRRYGRLINPALSVMAMTMAALSYYLTSLLVSAVQTEVWMSPKVIVAALAAWTVAGWRLIRSEELRALKMERTARSAVNACGVHALIFVLLLYLIDAPYVEWSTLAVFYALMFVSLPVAYVLSLQLLKFLRRRGRNHRRVVIVGMNDTASRLYSMMTTDGYGYAVVGVFDDNAVSSVVEGQPVMPVGELDGFIRANEVEEIFCTLTGDNESALLKSIEVADNNAVTLHIVPQLTRFVNRGFAVNEIGRLPVMTPLNSPLASRFNVFVKRALDIMASVVGVALFPLFFIPIAISIKLTSPGPIFYLQERTGLKGRTFRCLKFRTLLYDPSADESPVAKSDPRVTAVGRFLRKTSLDELPQVFNVLKGDMSIVGPRPHMVSHTDIYRNLVDRYMLRHTVKPGITGWAQVNGLRGGTDHLWKMERRVECD
ncbi:MAG: exopolysaccharide biosynthesis polyprenyl glycosylphosphotransferase, partial [Paramuribaculum sp.]|nr:exopolysaccharide biosynthesis polyprenyl glycosylphosphotransferase [Paramuribaculum sp.]